MSEKKPNRVWEILTKEYKYESIVLVVVSIVIMIITAYILNGTLTINPNFFLLGDYPTISAIVFFVAGFIGLVVGLWPLFKPSFKEINRLTPPTRRTYLDHTIKVFSFILGLIAIFLIYDTVVLNFIKWMKSIF